MADPLKVVQGRNRWVLLRTDRDGATPDQVEATAAAFLVKQFFPISPEGTNHLETIPSLSGGYYIGAARPVQIRASQDPGAFAMSGGKVLGHWKRLEADYAVEAQKPWYVDVEFDWRAPDATLKDWPRRAVNALGFAVDRPRALDWLLLAAYDEGAAPVPDQTWTGEATEKAKQVTRDLLGSATNLLLILGVGFLTVTALKRGKE